METPHRYPAVGGLAAWWGSLLCAGVAVGGALAGEWTVAFGVVLVGLVLEAMDTAVVFEVSPRGLARGLAVGGVLVGHARSVRWDAVEEIFTRWRRPGDFTVLETVVVTRGRERLTFGTPMGLAAYRSLLALVVRHAPSARRTGLTAQVLAEVDGGRPRPSRRLRAFVVVGLALLLLWALAVLGA